MFYCMFYFTCDRSLTANQRRTARHVRRTRQDSTDHASENLSSQEQERQRRGAKLGTGVVGRCKV